ncbi:MAG: FG-GAP-like repeat-containing protein [Xanthobacteraceae bacterium]
MIMRLKERFTPEVVLVAVTAMTTLWPLVGIAQTKPPAGGAPGGVHESSGRRHWDSENDHDASAAFQRARQQFIATWGFAPGQQAQPQVASFPITRWNSIGPARISEVQQQNALTASGRINSIALHPTDPNTIYVGAATGGVWRTSDGGANWLPLTDDQCSLEIGAVAVDPVSPNIIYAGTGDPQIGSAAINDRPGGCGILRSIDGGTSWTLIAGTSSFPGSRVEKLVIDPTTAGSTTSTTIFAATTNKGLQRSTDSGATWTQVLSGGDATDVVIHPNNPQFVFAAIGNPAGNASNGIYRSTDGGATFPTKLSTGFPTTNVGVIKFDVAHDSATIYAAVANTNKSLLGIFKSTSLGSNWSQVAASGVNGPSQLDYDITVTVDPTNANTVYFGAVSLFKSSNGGASFTEIAVLGVHVDYHVLVFQPGNSLVLYVGNDGGIYKSTDGGSGWTSLNSDLAITQIYPGGAVHPTGSSIVLAGTQDNGTIKRTNSAVWDALRNNQHFFLCGDGGFTAIDPVTPTTFYAACIDTVVWRSDDSGSSWAQKTNGININDPSTLPPLVMSPANSQTLFFGTNKVYKTIDRGENWTASSTTFPPGTVVLAIAPAASDPTVIYMISGAGVFKSTNGNSSYTQLNTGLAFLPNSIAVSPSDANTAFLGLGGPFSPAMVKTTDGGASWTDVSGNLPPVPVNAILLDPAAPTSRILVATQIGVFGTLDGGATWAPNGVGLPNVIVTDLKYNPATAEVIAFTYGRGAFKGSLNQAATHDFSGEGFSDIAWRQNTGPVAAWLMNGAQIVQSGVFGSVSSSWQLVGQRDFDGDGKHDWLWRESSGTLAMWFLNGLQLVAAKGVANVPTNWTVAGTGDFNGDFKGDILWRESTNGSVAIWLMDGFHILNSVSLGPVSISWQIVGTGDFDGDGSRDILWRDSSSGTVAIWFLDRRQRIIGTATLGVVPTNWQVVGTGDFNGDGIADTVWLDSNSHTVAIWLLNGGQILQGATLGTVPVEFVVADTGDFNADGKSDILWRHTTKGAVVIWFMNGAQISQAVNLGGVDLSWTIQGVNAD